MKAKENRKKKMYVYLWRKEHFRSTNRRVSGEQKLCDISKKKGRKLREKRIRIYYIMNRSLKTVVDESRNVLKTQRNRR